MSRSEPPELVNQGPTLSQRSQKLISDAEKEKAELKRALYHAFEASSEMDTPSLYQAQLRTFEATIEWESKTTEVEKQLIAQLQESMLAKTTRGLKDLFTPITPTFHPLEKPLVGGEIAHNVRDDSGAHPIPGILSPTLPPQVSSLKESIDAAHVTTDASLDLQIKPEKVRALSQTGIPCKSLLTTSDIFDMLDERHCQMSARAQGRAWSFWREKYWGGRFGQ